MRAFRLYYSTVACLRSQSIDKMCRYGYMEYPSFFRKEKGKRVDENSEKKSPCVITVAGGKGGVGKSAIAAYLAQWFAIRGMKTMLVDYDIGAPNLHTIL